MKNIGASLLPSSEPRILQPIALQPSLLWKGTLQVVPDEARDTYDLVFHEEGGKNVAIASHPNGYSCHCLAERIAERHRELALEQLCYIIACGGTVGSVAASMVSAMPKYRAP